MEEVEHRTCPKCGEPKPATTKFFYKSKYGTLYRCKTCVNKYQRIRRHGRRDEANKYHREWSAANPDKIKLHARNTKIKIKTELVYAYGGCCACCGETELEFLTVDHINGDGQQHRARVNDVYRDIRNMGYPKESFRILCMNCNFAIRFGKTCPHQNGDKVP